MKSAPVRLWWAWQGHVVHKYIGITWRALLRYLPCHGHMIIRLSTIWEPGTNSWTFSIIRLDRQASTKEPFLFFRSITSGRVIESVRSHPVPSSFQTHTKKKKKKRGNFSWPDPSPCVCNCVLDNLGCIQQRRQYSWLRRPHSNLTCAHCILTGRSYLLFISVIHSFFEFLSPTIYTSAAGQDLELKLLTRITSCLYMLLYIPFSRLNCLRGDSENNQWNGLMNKQSDPIQKSLLIQLG